MKSAFATHGLCVVPRNIAEAIEIVNRMAPEHLSLMVSEASSVSIRVRNAGCILRGTWSAQSAADYCLGPSHTIPTAGGARFGSPLSVQSFLRTSSVCDLSETDPSNLSPIVAAFGAMESLPTHGDACRHRID